MVDQDKPEQKNIPEKFPAGGEQIIPSGQENIKVPEKRESLRDDEIISAELKRELDLMENDETAKANVEKEKERIEFLGEKEKLQHLLQIAREKGVVYAIQVAKKMNDPYLLDLLHDILAKEGFYQKMGQTTDDDNDDDKKT